MLRLMTEMTVLALPAIALGQRAEAEEPAPAEKGGPPAEVQELFIAKCSSCHSVGDGDRVGPDLKGATQRRERDWLTRIITAPSAMLDSDPDARQLLNKYNRVRMPDLGLGAEQVAALIDLIDLCSETKCDLAAKLTPVTKATAADVERGRNLYIGTEPLKNFGPGCISCHTVEGTGAFAAGGTLSKDITHAFARLGDAGLDAALRNPAFPIMNKVFGEDHPLEEDEAFALRAYLYKANSGGLGHVGVVEHPLSVPLAAALGAVLALILLNAAWSRRLRGIRRPLVGGRERVS